MSSTEQERIELYELAKQEVGERFAELMIRALPPEPDDLVRRDHLAGTEQRLDSKIDAVAERLDARISVVAAELRTEMRELTSTQTRTMILGLVGSVTALAVTELIVSAL